MPSEAAASTHHAPLTTCAINAPTTTSESQPHVMLSMASARSARLPSASARRSLRRDRKYIVGMARALTIKAGRENSAPCCIHNFHPAPPTT